jgi:hypothetical protein
MCAPLSGRGERYGDEDLLGRMLAYGIVIVRRTRGTFEVCAYPGLTITGWLPTGPMLPGLLEGFGGSPHGLCAA